MLWIVRRFGADGALLWCRDGGDELTARGWFVQQADICGRAGGGEVVLVCDGETLERIGTREAWRQTGQLRIDGLDWEVFAACPE